MARNEPHDSDGDFIDEVRNVFNFVANEPAPDKGDQGVPVRNPDATADAPRARLPEDRARTISIEGYDIVRELHRGGQGVVYQAVQKSTKRKVAIKVLLEGPYASPSAKRRFEREIELVASLKHTNIISIFHSGLTPDGRQFCVMDYVRGKPIHRYCRDKKPTLEDVLKLFAKVCEAVNYAHQKGVIHRDLKPSNILVDSDGSPRVLDFGLAKMVGGPEQTLVSMTGQVIGTLPYMSPEQAGGNPDEIDIRTDVYALGVILYEMLTGQYPYPVAGQMADVLRNIAETPPAPLSQSWRSESGVTERSARRVRPGDCPIDGEVQTIVLKTLSKERERRYQSPGELARDLGHYLAGEPIEAKRDSALYILRKQLRRYKVPVAAFAVAFVVLVAGIIVSSWQALRAGRAEHLAEEHLLQAKRQASIAEAVNLFLNDELLAAVDPERTPNREITMREVLDAASDRIEGKFKNEPLIEASIRSTLGETYRGLGLYARAELHLREAEAIQTRELGEEDPGTLRTRSDLADLLRRRGWFLPAESLARQTLETQRRVLGDDHPSTASTLNALGLVLRRQGKYEEAASVFRQVMEIRRRTLGREHPDTLTSMSNLAKTLGNLGRWPDLAKGSGDVGRCAEAAMLHRETLEARKRILGAEHPQTLTSMSDLGLALRCLDRTTEAEAIIRQALAAQRRTLGQGHPDTLQSMYNLAGVIWRSGRLDEAEQVLKSALEAGRSTLGTAHLSVASTTDFLLRVLRARAKVEEARPYLVRENVEVAEGRFEELHANPYGLNALAYARLTYEPKDLRDPVEALPLAEKVVAITGGAPCYFRTLAIAYEANDRLADAIETLRKGLAQLEPDVFYWRVALETRLINALRKKDDSDGAEIVLRGILARTLTAQDEQRAHLVREMMELAVLLVAEDRFLQHEWFCADVAQVQQGIIPSGGPAIAGFVVIYASALVEKGRHAEAAPLLRRCLCIRELALPEGDWHTAHVRSVLGSSLSGQGKFAEAEPLLLDSYAKLNKNAQAIPQAACADRLRQALERIVKLYESWQAAQPDAGHDAKAAEWRTRLDTATSQPTGG